MVSFMVARIQGSKNTERVANIATLGITATVMDKNWAKGDY
jgi:hypothetical protein